MDLLNSNAVETWFIKNGPTIEIIAITKVGGIRANNFIQTDFLIENLKIQNNIIEN